MKKEDTRILAIAFAVTAMTVLVLAVEPGLILYLAPYPYEELIPNPGHGADVVWIDTTPGIPGGEMTVQDAVAAGFLNIDTKCDSAGICPQVCVGAVCRNSWPASITGITQLNQGSGITLSPNPITATGSISSNYSQVQQRVSGTCPEGQSIRVINQNGTVSCEVDSTCATSGTCGQLCIGSDCRNDWPIGGGNVAICGTSVNCDNKIDCDSPPCSKTADSGFFCGIAGGLPGECCLCAP